MELNMETFETYVSKMLDDGGFDLDRILTRVKWIGRKKKKEIETRKRKHGVDAKGCSAALGPRAAVQLIRISCGFRVRAMEPAHAWLGCDVFFFVRVCLLKGFGSLV